MSRYSKVPETEKQWFKVYALLKENGEMTVSEIASILNTPEPSVRRILSELKAIGRVQTIKKPCGYKLK